MNETSSFNQKAISYKCVILAAGMSTRLRPLTDTMPKCLLKVGGKTLLERTIENVLEVGINEIAIVVGYRAEMIRDFFKKQFPQKRIRFILNPNYAKTNNAYSLLLARRFLENKDGKVDHSLLLLDSDIVFSSKLLPFFIEQCKKNIPSHKHIKTIHGYIAVRTSGNRDEEEIRVKVNSDNDIFFIGKTTSYAETYGESIGIEKFSVKTAANLFTTLERRVRNGKGRGEFYEAAFQEMIDSSAKLTAVDVSAFPSIEIDTLEDFLLAERMNID
jgi:choline kinase